MRSCSTHIYVFGAHMIVIVVRRALIIVLDALFVLNTMKSGGMMKTFKLVRKIDVSGVSGTGDVAEGVEFEDGQVVICWLSKYHSIGVFDNIHCLEKIHGHEGSTEVVWEK